MVNSINKLNPKAIAMAFAILVVIFYIACFVIILFGGDSAIRFFNLFFHGIDLTSIKSNPSIANGIIGLIISAIISYIAAYVFAVIYNKFAK